MLFTGIIEDKGIVLEKKREKNILNLLIQSNILEGLKCGDSISVNGVCLTIVELNKNSFKVDVMEETLKKTNLGEFKIGDIVNLERALSLQNRLNGHFVLGHIDEVGVIRNKTKEEIEISCSKEIIKFIIKSGSIAVDGVSLTVADIKSNYFKVNLIPYTILKTNLGLKKIGDKVNLEADILGKYIEKFISKEEKINENFLREKGFL